MQPSALGPSSAVLSSLPMPGCRVCLLTGGGRKEVAAAWAEVPVYPWLCTLLRSSRTKHHGNEGDVRPTVSWKPATGIWVNKTNTSETQTGDLSGTPALRVLSPGISLGWVHPRFQKMPLFSKPASHCLIRRFLLRSNSTLPLDVFRSLSYHPPHPLPFHSGSSQQNRPLRADRDLCYC